MSSQVFFDQAQCRNYVVLTKDDVGKPAVKIDGRIYPCSSMRGLGSDIIRKKHVGWRAYIAYDVLVLKRLGEE